MKQKVVPAILSNNPKLMYRKAGTLTEPNWIRWPVECDDTQKLNAIIIVYLERSWRAIEAVFVVGSFEVDSSFEPMQLLAGAVAHQSNAILQIVVFAHEHKYTRVLGRTSINLKRQIYLAL